MRPIPKEAIDLVSKFEGCRLNAYKDVVGIITIGYGSTTNVTMGMTITKDEALARLTDDLRVAASAVTRLIKARLNDNQYAALTDFCYNLGSGSLQRSLLRMKLNRKDYKAASNEFMHWCKAGGRPLHGLVIRREAERALFLS